KIDGEPALDLINRLIGAITMNKSDSILLLPLSVREKITDRPVVRSIKSIDKIDNSITFTGNIKEGSYVRLMKSSIDRLINAAEGAAEVSIEAIGNTHTDFAIVTSCVGRRKVLKELVEEEVEAVRDVIGEDATIAGFYSYGEISPYISGTDCALQNQSIVVTSFSESDIE
ncbi:MAG: FIST C-terminal domain-containing protein, partial [Flavobacteriales bacterium]|nr:FIST C-terminal domain-containing protein [Flavobacteriales bacterium]